MVFRPWTDVVGPIVSLQAHEDAKSGHIVRAKKKAMATYLFIAAALVADVIIVVSVVVATIWITIFEWILHDAIKSIFVCKIVSA